MRSPCRALALVIPFVATAAYAAPAPDAHRPPVRAPQGPPKVTAPVTAGKTGSARWTSGAPDAMVAELAKRVKGGGDDALPAMAVLHALADRAAAGAVEHVLDGAGEGKGELAEQARIVAAMLDPVTSRAAPEGLVTDFLILGPFQDSGARLKEKEFPEEQLAAWGDRQAMFSWGVYDVRWRPLFALPTARGVPLDLYIRPRRETCTYLASRVTLAQSGPIVVHAASTGSVRLVWDGQTVGVSEDDHESAIFDRVASRIEGTAGDHLVALKVCAGAIDDEGRARVRIATPEGAPVHVTSSHDFSAFRGKTDAVKVTHADVKEPLAKALALGPHATAEQMLGAAILRTKGGADDLRSPRAPGLLDTVTKTPGLSADTLALAGWITPFGASRSGWLNGARDRALEQGDKEAADFAARRLIAARLDAGFDDWALALANAEPTASAKDLEAVMLRGMVRSEIGGDGAKRALLTELVDRAQQQPAAMSAVAWSEIAQDARGTDPKLEVRARDELARRSPERFDLDRVRAARSLDADAVQQAVMAALETGSITDADELDDLAQNLALAGKDKAAEDVLETSVVIAPNVAKVHADLAERLFASGRDEDKDIAMRVLVRARDLEPGDARLRAEIALRAKKDQQKGPQPDERFMLTPEQFLAKAKANPAKVGEVADRQLHWQRVVTMHDDRRVSQLIHYSREIVIAPRTQDELYEQIPQEGDETEIIRARVHRATGETSFAEEQKSDRGSPMIRWPDLKVGDVVEVAVRSWTSGPVGRRSDAPFYFFDYAGSLSTHPLLFNEVIVDSPKDKPIAIDVLHDAGAPGKVDVKEENGRTIARYVWDKPVSIPDEPYAPKASEVLPTIVGSTFASWADFRAWYQSAVAGFTEPDEQVKKLAQDLTKGKTTRDEKLHAIFDFVSDDIRYVNYVSGEWWLPNRPQQLLVRRQGDCDDKAILLITLLKSVGIDATEVLIQTRYTAQPSVLLSQKAAIPLFDHGIAYLPPKGKDPGIWLDATSPQSRLGPVPSMDTRTFALFANEGPAQMVPTPKGSPDDYGAKSSWTLWLTPDGGADLDADEVHRGDQAFYLRSNLREVDARAPWVEQNLVAGWIPEVQVEKNVAFEPDLAGGTARVRYQATTRGLGRRDGDELSVTLSAQATLTSQLAALPKRTLPVQLPPNLAPSRQTRVVRLVAPEGMKVGDLPAGGTEDGGEFGKATLTVEIDKTDPDTVVMTRDLTFDLERIPVEKYEAWRTWLSRVDSLMHRAVRFVPRPAGSPPQKPRPKRVPIEIEPPKDAKGKDPKQKKTDAPAPAVPPKQPPAARAKDKAVKL